MKNINVSCGEILEHLEDLKERGKVQFYQWLAYHNSKSNRNIMEYRKVVECSNAFYKTRTMKRAESEIALDYLKTVIGDKSMSDYIEDIASEKKISVREASLLFLKNINKEAKTKKESIHGGGYSVFGDSLRLDNYLKVVPILDKSFQNMMLEEPDDSIQMSRKIVGLFVILGIHAELESTMPYKLKFSDIDEADLKLIEEIENERLFQADESNIYIRVVGDDDCRVEFR